ncbi:MAG: hypothetical protein AB2A00_14380 [Myxococcota bacterium]
MTQEAGSSGVEEPTSPSPDANTPVPAPTPSAVQPTPPVKPSRFGLSISWARVCGPVAVVALAMGWLWRFMVGPLGGLGPLDATESVVGLMARSFWEDFPQLFLWGRPFQGALEPLAAAAVFSLLDEGADTLRLVPWATAAGTAVVAVAMAGRWLGAQAALVAALTTALALPGPTAMLARALGGVSLGTMLGLLALGGAAGVSLNEPRRLSMVTGVLCGLAVLAHPSLVAFAVGASASVALGLLGVLWSPLRLLSAVRHGWRFLVGMLLGASPVLWTQGLKGLPSPRTELPLATVTHGATAAAGWLETFLGSPHASTLVGVMMVLAAFGTFARLVLNGVDDPAARLGAGVLVTSTVSALLTLSAGDNPDEAAYRALPLVACLPAVAALGAASARSAVLTVIPVVLLLVQVDPTTLPPSREVGADVPVDDAVAFLDRTPGLKCYAASPLAYRVSMASAGRHRCVALRGPDLAPRWRADAATGRRAYFFAPEEVEEARALDEALERLRRVPQREVVGPFLARITTGLSWPPRPSPIVWEHARRERSAAIDGDVETAVTLPAGSELKMELVWPTVLSSVIYWQDVTALANAPCRMQASIITTSGQVVNGPATNLITACNLARDWALWPTNTLEVTLPLPAQEASAITARTLDSDGRGTFSAIEVRVRPKEARAEH